MPPKSKPAGRAMRALCTHIAAARTQPLPARVVEKAKHHLLDTLAAMMTGSRLKVGKIAIDYVRGQGGKKEAQVVGTAFMTTAVNAALANG
ncbi:MAG: MmgE/PrpD family protein, partial [Alphaproteobacteria bacterium]|nr:MmgE/PrpD family protein [Alphaproteobacteria bacterium]